MKEVRGSEVLRLLGNKANPHNRMKKNRLCGLMFVLKQSISMLEDLENLESLEILRILSFLRILILYKDNINNISLTQHW